MTAIGQALLEVSYESASTIKRGPYLYNYLDQLSARASK